MAPTLGVEMPISTIRSSMVTSHLWTPEPRGVPFVSSPALAPEPRLPSSARTQTWIFCPTERESPNQPESPLFQIQELSPSFRRPFPTVMSYQVSDTPVKSEPFHQPTLGESPTDTCLTATWTLERLTLM